MNIKDIIDNHITNDYSYYNRISKRYYNNRYLADDMTQELYLSFLKVKPEVIKKFNEINKLRLIGGRILLSLYSKRNQGTKNKGKSVSPLHETPTISLFDVVIPSEESHEDIKEVLDLLMRGNDTWFFVTVFQECQEQSILQLSNKTKISRSYLTMAYKKGKELLYNELNK